MGVYFSLCITNNRYIGGMYRSIGLLITELFVELSVQWNLPNPTLVGTRKLSD